jgi:predicted transcriptional regulator YdeE
VETHLRVEGPFHLAGFRVVAPWQELAIRVPEAWARLLAEMERGPGVTDPHVLYGPSLEGETYSVWTCVAFDPTAALPAGWERLDLPARTYATRRYRGPQAGITAAYQEIFDELKVAGRSRAPGAHGLERYARAFRDMGRPATPEELFDYEVLVPVTE